MLNLLLINYRETNHKYWLMVEPKTSSADSSSSPNRLSVPSQLCNTLSRMLDHPSVQYVTGDEYDAADGLLMPKVNLVSTGLACDLHLFNLRTMSDPAHPTAPSKKALMILHRQGRECGLNDHGGKKNMILSSLLSNNFKTFQVVKLALLSLPNSPE